MKYIIIDTETTNDIDCPIVYDVGFAVIDATGKVYASYSYVVADVFCDDELMSTAYFADKIPSYWEDIKSHSRILKSFRTIEKIFRKVCAEWDVNTFIAHNARFDYLALNNTKRYLTSSKYRFFFPYGSEFVDTLRFSRNVLGNDSAYREYCVKNQYVTKSNINRYTAEILYRYIKSDEDFIESHTALEDVLIEKEIFVYCMGRDSTAEKRLWASEI